MACAGTHLGFFPSERFRSILICASLSLFELIFSLRFEKAHLSFFILFYNACAVYFWDTAFASKFLHPMSPAIWRTFWILGRLSTFSNSFLRSFDFPFQQHRLRHAWKTLREKYIPLSRGTPQTFLHRAFCRRRATHRGSRLRLNSHSTPACPLCGNNCLRNSRSRALGRSLYDDRNGARCRARYRTAVQDNLEACSRGNEKRPGIQRNFDGDNSDSRFFCPIRVRCEIRKLTSSTANAIRLCCIFSACQDNRGKL